ncbi:MAG: MarR family winged helix-turn-helix transcriptional regulator [Candidatus Dormibacteria bacterium]
MSPQPPGNGQLARHELGPAVETLTRVARILERASGELSLSHYRVLTMVAAGDGRASRLAERLALGKPAISAAVDSLVKRGMLSRSGEDPDRRATRLEITTSGRGALAACESAMADALAELLRHTEDVPPILRALEDLSLALSRRQRNRETEASAATHPTAAQQ